MPITGQEEVYETAIINQIEAGILLHSGFAVQNPRSIEGLAHGIAYSTIPFLVANVLIPAGIAVAVDPNSGIGATTGVGVIT